MKDLRIPADATATTFFSTSAFIFVDGAARTLFVAWARGERKSLCLVAFPRAVPRVAPLSCF